MSRALDYLDNLNVAGRIDYDAYSHLHDLISTEIAVANGELEYGWEWASSPNLDPQVIHGSATIESARRAMYPVERKIAPVRIMVREKAAAGPWREA